MALRAGKSRAKCPVFDSARQGNVLGMRPQKAWRSTGLAGRDASMRLRPVSPQATSVGSTERVELVGVAPYHSGQIYSPHGQQVRDGGEKPYGIDPCAGSCPKAPLNDTSGAVSITNIELQAMASACQSSLRRGADIPRPLSQDARSIPHSLTRNGGAFCIPRCAGRRRPYAFGVRTQ